VASWNEFVMTTGPTATIGPKAIYTADTPALFTKFSTAVMGSVPIAGHYLDATEKSQLERGVSAVGLGTDDQKVDVSKQKHVDNVIFGGIARNDLAYITRGLLGIRGGLAYRNGLTIAGVTYDSAHINPDSGFPYLPDGGFPSHKFGTTDSNHKLHNRMMFCEHAARGLRAVKASAFYTGATATEVDALVVQLGEVAAWLLAATVQPNDDWAKFYRNTSNVNQLLRVAVGLHEIGLLTGTGAYVTAAQARVEEIFSATVQPGQTSRHISPGGVFKEKRDTQGDTLESGFDVTYQTVSLDNLCTYYMTLAPGAWADTVYGFICLGVARWLHVVQLGGGGPGGRHRKNRRSRQRPIYPTQGVINDQGSTRTLVTGYAPGPVPVDIDRDVTPSRMQMWHYLGVSTTLGLRIDILADQIMLAGPSFGHQPGDPDEGDF
jgi:hypothetical protein